MKLLIRKEALEKRRSLPLAEVNHMSMIVQQKAFTFCKSLQAKTVFVYLAQKEEVQTELLVHSMLESGISVCVPVCIENKMFAQQIDGNTPLINNRFNIPEPEYKQENIIKPEKLDIVFVPGIAFDRSFHRIGYGKGFYDAFLTGIHVTKIALAFDCQIYGVIPCERFDVPMDYIVTPTCIYKQTITVTK